MEIYQNCPIFNDGAFDGLEGPASGLIPLKHGEPIRFGTDGELGVVRGADGALQVARVDEVGIDRLLVHDAHREDPSLAFELSRLTDAGTIVNAPVGIFRQVERPTYDDLARSQVSMAEDPGQRLAELQGLINGSDTWTV